MLVAVVLVAGGLIEKLLVRRYGSDAEDEHPTSPKVGDKGSTKPRVWHLKGYGPMQLHLILKFVLLLAIANGTPVIAEKVLGRFLSYPLDAGKTFVDGRPLFGSSKTIRGIVVAAIAASACAPVFRVAWTTGLVIGVAAMAGDLISSFVKRRMNYPPSSRALGLDQIPEFAASGTCLQGSLGAHCGRCNLGRCPVLHW